MAEGNGIAYEDEYPKHLGPPPVANYGAAKAMKATALTPTYIVELDEGALRRLWEIAEADSKMRFPTREIMHSVKAQLRAVDELRRVWWAHHDSPTPGVVGSVVPQRGRRVRRVSPSEAPAPTVEAAPPAPTPASTPSGASKRRVVRRSPLGKLAPAPEAPKAPSAPTAASGERLCRVCSKPIPPSGKRGRPAVVCDKCKAK